MAWSLIPLQSVSRPSRPGLDSLPAAYQAVDPARREPRAAEGPRNVFIEVTNHCNLLCETCPRTFVTYEEPKTLTWDDFLRIIAQFPNMERAILHGIGEPLLNKQLPQMINHLKGLGVYVLFNTNATLLDDRWARRLIEAGLDELRVSIDGADPKTYALIRGAPLLHKLVKNLSHFVAVQRALGADRPLVSLWMTGMRENIAELPAVVRLAARIGVPEVYLQRLVYYANEPSAPGLMTGQSQLFEQVDEAIDATIQAAETVAAQLGVTLRASGATTPRRSLQGEAALAPVTADQPWTACMRPWTTAYITANGNALPCCIAPFATLDYESLKLGNVFEQPFDTVWNDVPYQAWRRRLLSDQPHPACANCGVCWSL
jgi:MoaA/NifB/PqqE/SkfB family radical SAM enzyme